jgi:hypothetical protein
MELDSVRYAGDARAVKQQRADATQRPRFGGSLETRKDLVLP